MKKIVGICLFIWSIPCFAQKQYYATILDADNNPQARGILQNVLDSGITIEVDKTPVFINTASIYVILIERNAVKLEFMKLASTVATQTAASLMSQSADSVGTANKGNNKLSPLLENLQELLNKAMEQNDQIARFRIDGSIDILKTKLSILQQYSVEVERDTRKQLSKPATSYAQKVSGTITPKPFISQPKKTITVQDEAGNKSSRQLPGNYY